MDPHKRNVGVALGSLLASSGTLLCCVLPAVLVSLGAGAAMVGLVSTFPQLVWLSERKVWVFGIAALMLVVSAALLWNARRLPCPVDPTAARSCMKLRRISAALYVVAACSYLLGVVFAYGLPLIADR
jgi:hypothetical protein